MSHANKNHHRKVKHHSDRPGSAQDTPTNNNQEKAAKNKEAGDTRVVKTPSVPGPKSGKTPESKSGKTNANTAVENSSQNKTKNKPGGADTSLHLGDSTLQSPEEHRKDEQTDQTKTDKTEVNF